MDITRKKNDNAPGTFVDGTAERTLPLVVCIGSSCHLKGSRQVVEQLQELIAQYHLGERIELSGTFCMGNCQNGVCVTFDGKPFSLSPDTVASFFTEEILSFFH